MVLFCRQAIICDAAKNTASMRILITGANGMVGTAITDHLGTRDEYEFVGLDHEDHPDRETFVADVSDYEAIRPAFDNVDAVIHLAVYPPGIIDENWEMIRGVNIEGTRNVLRAASEAEVETVIFASTNHVVGMYEEEHAPKIFELNHDLLIDHTSAPRPDSSYGVSKLFGENDGRFHIETMEYPKQFVAIRICSLRTPEYDHAYGDAEKGVDEGQWERGSEEYERAVARMKAMWFSRRDCAQMVDQILQNDSIEFDIFSGVSGNDRRWFDIDHAREVIGYDPQDNGEEWDAPPE